jgi:hypothetical protein
MSSSTPSGNDIVILGAVAAPTMFGPPMVNTGALSGVPIFNSNE